MVDTDRRFWYPDVEDIQLQDLSYQVLERSGRALQSRISVEDIADVGRFDHAWPPEHSRTDKYRFRSFQSIENNSVKTTYQTYFTAIANRLWGW